MDPLLSVSPTVSSSATLIPTSHWIESVHQMDMDGDIDVDVDVDVDVDPTTLSPPTHKHKRIRPRTEVVEPNLSIETTTTTTTTNDIFTPRIPLLQGLLHSLTLPFSFHNRHHLLLISLLCATTCHFLLFSWYTHLILTLAAIAISAATYSAYLFLSHYGLLYFLPPFLVDFLTHYSLLDISQMSWSSGITSDLACLFLFSLTPEEQDVITSRLPYEFQRLLRKRGIIQFLPSSLHHLIGLDQLQKIQQEQIRHQLEQEAVSPIMRSTPEPIARGFSHSSSHPSLLAFHRAAMSSLTTSRSHPTRMYTLDHSTWEHDEKYDDDESKGEPDALSSTTSITLPSSTSTTTTEERPINITTLLDRSVKHTIQSVVNNNSTIEYVHQVICNTWISFLPTSLRELITSPTIVNDTLNQIPIRLITCTSLFTLCIHLMISRNARMVARHVVTTGAEVSLYVTATAALTGMLYSYQQKQQSSSQHSSIITTKTPPLTQRLIQFFMSHKFSLGGFVMIAWILFLKRRRLGM